MNRIKLIEAGVDYDEGVARFGGNPQLYEKYLAKFFVSSLMDDFERQLAAKDYVAAFRTMHDLKGAAGNLSINAYYAKVCELTELLRPGKPEADCEPLFLQVKAMYNTAKQAVMEE